MGAVTMSVDASVVTAAVDRVRDRIAGAGGDPDQLRLVAVTKGQPIEVVTAALAAGVTDLGENYAQELAGKVEQLEVLDDRHHAAPEVGMAAGSPPQPPPTAPSWHFIGRLQRNKVRAVAPFVALWQSVDRLSLGAEIARRCPGASVLVQVNISDEPQKGGCRPELVAGVVEGCTDLGLDVRGLMAVGPLDDPEVARPEFRRVRELADRLGLAERSMGMSSDLEVAVAEGATMIRVGSALFGPRPGSTGVGH